MSTTRQNLRLGLRLYILSEFENQISIKHDNSQPQIRSLRFSSNTLSHIQTPNPGKIHHTPTELAKNRF